MKFNSLFPKISFPVILIAFLLPFVLVKCGNTTIARLNGVDMVTGTHVGEGDDVQQIDPNLYVLGAFVLAAVGLVLAFFKKKEIRIAALAVSVLGFLSLIGFYFDVTGEVPGKGKMIVIISLGVGYYIAIIGFLANSLFFGLSLTQKEDRLPPVLPGEND
ncbi:MAG: hypothetical protein CVU11_03585 [Bacteroidetes bacterium HGW-Bacteroidetes-6]|jgi:hypothetical protein|nr:MAG: hypothetical protein CVU11_03585 [Bacteroidetes bacterium HGW-Bacteroidetes-6]